MFVQGPSEQQADEKHALSKLPQSNGIPSKLMEWIIDIPKQNPHSEQDKNTRDSHTANSTSNDGWIISRCGGRRSRRGKKVKRANIAHSGEDLENQYAFIYRAPRTENHATAVEERGIGIDFNAAPLRSGRSVPSVLYLHSGSAD